MSTVVPREHPARESGTSPTRASAAQTRAVTATARDGPNAAWSNSPRQLTQRAEISQLQESIPAPTVQRRARASASGESGMPAQLTHGSSQANAELIAAMGQSAALVDKLPNAKPHTTRGQGNGGGTDHQARNAQVIRKSQQDTMRNHGNPTMFQSNQMRSARVAAGKDAAAASKREVKNAAKKASGKQAIADYWGIGLDEVTSDHVKAYHSDMSEAQ